MGAFVSQFSERAGYAHIYHMAVIVQAAVRVIMGERIACFRVSVFGEASRGVEPHAELIVFAFFGFKMKVAGPL